MFDVINYGEERQIRIRRRLAVLVVLASTGLFYYPHVKAYRGRWQALSATRAIAEYIQHVKTVAILDKKSVEVRFTPPATLEVMAVPGCGVGGHKVPISIRSLSEFAPGLEYITGSRLASVFEAGTEHTVLSRICYDPLQGSSLGIDGVLHGGIVLGLNDKDSTETHWARLVFSGTGADIEIE
jgi:hypothetical protein